MLLLAAEEDVVAVGVAWVVGARHRVEGPHVCGEAVEEVEVLVRVRVTVRVRIRVRVRITVRVRVTVRVTVRVRVRVRVPVPICSATSLPRARSCCVFRSSRPGAWLGLGVGLG